MPRAKQRTPELRERVVRAAVETLGGAGVAGFTTRKVAEAAATSIPAVYELFGDRSGLVREVFFDGFRRLRSRFDPLRESEAPLADLVDVIGMFRAFVRDEPALAAVMFSRPFSDFDCGPEEVAAGSRVRDFLIGRVRRCLDAGLLEGDETDIAHVLLALAQGLAAQESAGWLGSSAASMDRRWKLAFEAALAGLAPHTAGDAERR